VTELSFKIEGNTPSSNERLKISDEREKGNGKERFKVEKENPGNASDPEDFTFLN